MEGNAVLLPLTVKCEGEHKNVFVYTSDIPALTCLVSANETQPLVFEVVLVHAGFSITGGNNRENTEYTGSCLQVQDRNVAITNID